MPKLFLDLDDDVLQHIAHFVHQDNQIPLPSFSPHWINATLQIHPAVQRDYLSLRSTYKRVRDLWRLKGLHVRMESWEKVEKWDKHAPQTVRDGVRRLVLDMPTHLFPNDQPSHSSSRNLKHIYATLARLLFTMTSLEELVIMNTPLCHHSEEHNTPNHLQVPSKDFLPNLKSLSFQLGCWLCSKRIPRLFVLPSPKLEHLKITRTDGVHEQNIRFIKLLSTWEKRHSKSLGSQLRTLYLKMLDPYLVPHEDLREIPKMFPRLENLDLSMHWYGDELFEPYFTIFGGSSGLNDDDGELGWDIKLFLGSDSEPETDFYREGAEVDRMDHFLTTLGDFENLQILDLRFVVVIDTPKPSSITSHTTLRQEEVYRQRLVSAMTAAAQRLLERCPTLTKGFFWDQRGATFDGYDIWNRWTWTRQSTLDGAYHAVVDPLPEIHEDLALGNGDAEDELGHDAIFDPASDGED